MTSGKKNDAANLIGTVTKTKDAMEAKAKVKVRAKPDIATTAESKGTSECIVHTQADQQH